MDAHGILFAVRRSIRYHNRRRMFYERWNKVTTLLGAISATAIFTSVVGEFGKKFELAVAFLLAFVTYLDLVVSSARMARLHSDLYRQFIQLEKELVLAGEEPSDETLRLLCAKRLEIEADEPPVLTILNLMCHNEIVRAYGYGEAHVVKLQQLQCLLAQFWDVGEEKALAQLKQQESLSTAV